MKIGDLFWSTARLVIDLEAETWGDRLVSLRSTFSPTQMLILTSCKKVHFFMNKVNLFMEKVNFFHEKSSLFHEQS